MPNEDRPWKLELLPTPCQRCSIPLEGPIVELVLSIEELSDKTIL
jgi:hypothetical protein